MYVFRDSARIFWAIDQVLPISHRFIFSNCELAPVCSFIFYPVKSFTVNYKSRYSKCSRWLCDRKQGMSPKPFLGADTELRTWANISILFSVHKTGRGKSLPRLLRGVGSVSEAFRGIPSYLGIIIWRKKETIEKRETYPSARRHYLGQGLPPGITSDKASITLSNASRDNPVGRLSAIIGTGDVCPVRAL